MKLLMRLLIAAVVIFGVAYLSGGSLLVVRGDFNGFMPALWAALVLGLANAVVKPIIKLVALPITIGTLGLFSLVINMFMLYLTAWVVPGLQTVGIWQTFVAALIISIAVSVFTRAAERD